MQHLARYVAALLFRELLGNFNGDVPLGSDLGSRMAKMRMVDQKKIVVVNARLIVVNDC